MISRIAAPVGAVTIPTVFANRGIGRLYCGSNIPISSSSLRVFQISDTGPRARKVRFLTRRAGIFRPARRHPQFLLQQPAVLGKLKVEAAALACEHDSLKCSAAVFQCEIDMSGTVILTVETSPSPTGGEEGSPVQTYF